MDKALTFTIATAMAEDIIAHARAGYPAEVCGLIGGVADEGLILRRAKNVSPTPATAFEMDVRALAEQAAWEDAGLALVAIYHSHPHGPSYPSNADIAADDGTGTIHIICSLADPTHPVLNAYQIVSGITQEVKLKT
jgi:proteasome lid subunit RPN8/RPN11